MRKILPILILCIIIILVVYFVFPPAQSTKVQVVVASCYIPLGTTITSDMVRLKEFPKEYIQPGAVFDIKEVIKQITLAPISEGEQILANKISKKSFSLATSIPIGKRAVTIPVDSVSGVAGLILPNDYVDILVTFDTSEGGKYTSYTTTLLQKVRVVAVGKKFHIEKKEEEEITYDNITLELTNEEAELVTFASEKGKIKLSLRPPADTTIITPKSVKFTNLLEGIRKKEMPKEQPSQPPKVIPGVEEK
jgi:pilus assembly protein CpaB